MPCVATKNDGHLCGRPSHGAENPTHLQFCNLHWHSYERHAAAAGIAARHANGQPVHHQAGRCLHFTTTHRWCQHPAIEGRTQCLAHQHANDLKAARVVHRNAGEARAREIANAFLGIVPLSPWRDVTVGIHALVDDPLANRRAAALLYYRTGAVAMLEPPGPWREVRPEWRFEEFWSWLVRGMQGPAPIGEPRGVQLPGRVLPAPPVIPQLGRMARDPQNVHTTAVSTQTNVGMEKLLAIEVSKTQETEKTLLREWLAMPRAPIWGEMLNTLNDINRWFHTKSCRMVNDNLYKKLLRGLVATILTAPKEARSELYRRAWEECHESTSMCCEGHISRLCNVMVGFDDAFQSPVPFGEILQNKMAAIYAMEIDTVDKIKQANAFFDEYAVPEAERASWIDAF